MADNFRLGLSCPITATRYPQKIGPRLWVTLVSRPPGRESVLVIIAIVAAVVDPGDDVDLPPKHVPRKMLVRTNNTNHFGVHLATVVETRFERPSLSRDLFERHVPRAGPEAADSDDHDDHGAADE